MTSEKIWPDQRTFGKLPPGNNNLLFNKEGTLFDVRERSRMDDEVRFATETIGQNASRNYDLFFKEMHPLLRLENPKMRFKEMSTAVRLRWRRMSVAEQQAFGSSRSPSVPSEEASGPEPEADDDDDLPELVNLDEVKTSTGSEDSSPALLDLCKRLEGRLSEMVLVRKDEWRKRPCVQGTDAKAPTEELPSNPTKAAASLNGDEPTKTGEPTKTDEPTKTGEPTTRKTDDGVVVFDDLECDDDSWRCGSSPADPDLCHKMMWKMLSQQLSESRDEWEIMPFVQGICSTGRFKVQRKKQPSEVTEPSVSGVNDTKDSPTAGSKWVDNRLHAREQYGGCPALTVTLQTIFDVLVGRLGPVREGWDEPWEAVLKTEAWLENQTLVVQSHFVTLCGFAAEHLHRDVREPAELPGLVQTVDGLLHLVAHLQRCLGWNQHEAAVQASGPPPAQPVAWLETRLAAFERYGTVACLPMQICTMFEIVLGKEQTIVENHLLEAWEAVLRAEAWLANRRRPCSVPLWKRRKK